MKKFFLVVVMIAVFAAVATVSGYYWLIGHYASTSGPFAQETVMEIAPGTPGRLIAESLEERGIIRHAPAFRLLAWLRGKAHRFQAGEYLFTPGMTPLGVMEKLVSGDVIRYHITIPEGKTSVEITGILERDPILKGKMAQLPLEGSLLPETYEFTRGVDRPQLLERMARAQQKLLEKAWPRRQDGLPLTTPQEAITLASIVEKETGLAEERRRVAAVYLNRLKTGMPLQADPTVAYGIYGGQYADKPLTYENLKNQNPYNTYLNKGLPPGPICHPGRAAIEAVLNPLQTKELYFVARGDGGHYFAETHTQHQKNVKEYRRWKKEISDK